MEEIWKPLFLEANELHFARSGEEKCILFVDLTTVRVIG